jgi:hypothetical protein
VLGLAVMDVSVRCSGTLARLTDGTRPIAVTTDVLSVGSLLDLLATSTAGRIAYRAR